MKYNPKYCLLGVIIINAIYLLAFLNVTWVSILPIVFTGALVDPLFLMVLIFSASPRPTWYLSIIFIMLALLVSFIVFLMSFTGIGENYFIMVFVWVIVSTIYVIFLKLTFSSSGFTLKMGVALIILGGFSYVLSIELLEHTSLILFPNQIWWTLVTVVLLFFSTKKESFKEVV